MTTSPTLNVRRRGPLFVAMFGVGRGAAADLVDVFRQVAAIVRGKGYQASAYDLWRTAGLKNPGNVAAGRIGGKTASGFMTPQQRLRRARRAGNVSMHDDPDGNDPTTASARGRWIARVRWTGKRPGPTPWERRRR